ncbi:MAG: hypothetical protein CBC29_06360 [Methylococcaceae bacterium TMED69]|nr:MAG: hypothetical protein CBC29_06360 [Methylococcaceae bacterium TMED69]|tara:strand:- start:189 stop:455 length:267 start_codon:yes stop_codon:yes gene_type:complete
MGEKNGRKNSAEGEVKMKVGDVVMFTDSGTYARWFLGQMGIVEKYTPVASDGRAHCSVAWLKPVKYHDRYTSHSNFSADKFEVYNETL